MAKLGLQPKKDPQSCDEESLSRYQIINLHHSEFSRINARMAAQFSVPPSSIHEDDNNPTKLLQEPSSVAELSAQSHKSTSSDIQRIHRFVQPNRSMEASTLGKLQKSNVTATITQDNNNNDSNKIVAGHNASPLNCTWNIPKRVKPGRKPATDTPPTKRKAQNRAAQRAFRERKAARIDTLEDEKQQIRDEFKQLELQYHNKIIQAVESVRVGLEKEVAHWKDKAERLEQLLELERRSRKYGATSGSGDYKGLELSPSSTLPLTPTSNDTALHKQEIDPCIKCGEDGRCPCLEKYTAVTSADGNDVVNDTNSFGETQSADQGPKMLDNQPVESVIPVDFTDYGVTDKIEHEGATDTKESDENCGFCVSDGICICKSELARAMNSQEQDFRLCQPSLATTTLSNSLVEEGPGNQSIMTSSIKVSPGTCKDCQSNPQQRKICQRLAKERPLLPSTSGKLPNEILSRQDFAANVKKSLQNVETQESMPCSQFFRLFKDNSISMDPDRSQWMHNVYTIPNDRKDETRSISVDCNTAGNAAYEIAAANILATLNQASRESKKLEE